VGCECCDRFSGENLSRGPNDIENHCRCPKYMIYLLRCRFIYSHTTSISPTVTGKLHFHIVYWQHFYYTMILYYTRVLLKQLPALNGRCLRECNSVDFDFPLRYIYLYIIYKPLYVYHCVSISGTNNYVGCRSFQLGHSVKKIMN
jgi:hypothetical protein